MSDRFKAVLLGDIVIPKGIQTGPFGSQLKAEEYTEDGVPVVMPKDICSGYLTSSFISRVSQSKANKLKKHQIKEGDIIFPRRGDLRRIGVARKDNTGWICGTGCLRARLNSVVHSDFLHQYVLLDSVGKWLERNALGQTMLNLSTDIISNLPLTLPLLSEQKAIADLLSAWDEAIEKAERLIQEKERRFRWLLRELISEPRNTRKDAEWKKVRMGSFLTESRIPDRENDPKKRISVRLHLRGVEVREYRGTESNGATAYFIRKAGQFIYGKQNVFRGAVGIVPLELDGYSSTQDIPAFDIADHVDKSWLLFLFSYTNFYKKLELYASGSGSKRLHPKELFRMKITLPTFGEQQQIAETLSSAQYEIDLLKQLAEKYKTQKRGLMQKMLAGTWRVKPEIVHQYMEA
ncbi:MAG: restriction endonuclease subunit S [Chlorobium phaeobacteroides]|uniref:Restriction modification system DNA specificity domain n=1 Tax=Chlorobium phaeobacteroides (strain BS1) TaxID=331678 RepID=B3EQE4_CHLPB|nr:restriction endonuclease subunit S [Chlorobium phaeobacteroides]MBL6956228.1 restriction endonuclease subunit S [Chlorobium phaeobacteroides]